MSFISNKSQKTPHSVIREMFAMQAGLDNVISFALGEPDFTAPQHVIDATVASLQRGETHYTPTPVFRLCGRRCPISINAAVWSTSPARSSSAQVPSVC